MPTSTQASGRSAASAAPVAAEQGPLDSGRGVARANRSTEDRACRSDDLLFFVVVGTISTILGYRFGTGVQLEQFPLILKLLDPSYLPRDFFTASATQFGPRFYYAHTLAWLASWIPLPGVILGLTLAVNIALVAITYFAARSLLRADRLAGFISALLAVSVGSFPLGLVTDIRFQTFQPGSLAIVGALGSLWAGLKARPLLAASLAGVASLMQPLYGAETGVVALAACGSGAFLNPGIPRRERLRVLLWTAAGFSLLGVATLTFWIVPVSSAARLPDGELIGIVAYFRSPHHYIPSTFPLRHYASFAAFFAGSALAWHIWRRTQGSRDAVVFAVPSLVVLLACLGGYLFVEVWPTRAWMTAQPFRLLFIIKWQGFLVLGWLIGSALRAASAPTRILGLLMLAATGAAQPPMSFVGAAALSLQHASASGSRAKALIPAAVACLAVVFAYLFGVLSELILVSLGSGAAVLLASRSVRARDRAVVAVASAAVVAGVFLNHATRWSQWDFIQPVLSWSDHHDDGADIARWSRQHTPPDALFLTPPGMPSFRLIAERAIVADFWAIPYVEPVMREWKQRLERCYGETSRYGFSALDEMDRRYRSRTDAELSEIAGVYSAAFAVIYAETPTTYPVLYSNSTYQIVTLRSNGGR